MKYSVKALRKKKARLVQSERKELHSWTAFPVNDKGNRFRGKNDFIPNVVRASPKSA